MTNSDQTQTGVISLAPALARLENDRELLCDLARFYLEDSPALIKELQRGIESGDFELITRTAHSLKGLASTFDAHNAVAAARAVELSSRGNHLTAVREQLPELEEASRQVAVALQTELLNT